VSPSTPQATAVNNGTDSASQESIPDISLAQAESIQNEIKDDAPREVIVEEMVHLAYDNTVSDAIKNIFYR